MDGYLRLAVQSLTDVLATVDEILDGKKSIEVKTSASGTKVYSVIPCPFRRPN